MNSGHKNSIVTVPAAHAAWQRARVTILWARILVDMSKVRRSVLASMLKMGRASREKKP